MTNEVAEHARSTRADFLWPNEDESIESAGYEFSNGKSENYQKLWWGILLKRVQEAECERCARIAERMTLEYDEDDVSPLQVGSLQMQIAAAIRAGKGK